MEPKLSNMKEVSLRRSLLTYCRESFEALLEIPLNEAKKDDEKEEDRMEREFKTKHKLFGNIEFVGELFKLYIITEQVMQQVLSSLLGIGTQSDHTVNDNTVEAAIKLMTNIGITLESRIAKNPEKAKKLIDMTSAAYERLKELENFSPENPANRASLRIKILIKNMFDNKASGWLKSKNEGKKI